MLRAIHSFFRRFTHHYQKQENRERLKVCLKTTMQRNNAFAPKVERLPASNLIQVTSRQRKASSSPSPQFAIISRVRSAIFESNWNNLWVICWRIDVSFRLCTVSRCANEADEGKILRGVFNVKYTQLYEHPPNLKITIY